MNNSIWIEKYRPTCLNDIIGQDNNIELLRNLIKNNSLPHLLFYGNSGVGKTSTINSIVNTLYGKNKSFMVMKLDASDDRGINSVRDEIKGFAEKQTIFNKGIKLIILDEADSMTFDAQFALRRIIEKYSDNTRFCLICNYDNKIIKPIKSRCVNIRFYPIKNNIIVNKLEIICKKENIKYSKKAIETIANIVDGDMRKSINILQSIHSLGSKIKSLTCYNTLGIPKQKIISNFLNLLLNNDILLIDVIKYAEDKFINEGIYITELLKILFDELLNNMSNIIEIKGQDKYMEYITEMAKLEKMCVISTFSDNYIIGLVSIFKKN
jgi:replication factor C subunit 3/5